MKIEKYDIFGKLFILVVCIFLHSGNVVAGTNDCQPSGNLKYICGPQNAEDILQIGNSDWLVISGMDGSREGTGVTGHLYLVNHRLKTYEVFFPGANPVYKQDRTMFADCPGPINPDKFSAHGLALQKQPDGRYRLYITSHGEREAIEIFDIDNVNSKPSISWVGCVMLPDHVWSNSVAILPDGGFVTTNFMDLTKPGAFTDVMQGRITGNVYEWHPGGKVRAIAGTDLSGANGIALSPDNRWMYVDAFGAHQVVRFDRSASPITKETVAVPITPDNIRWGADGLLYVVGINVVAPKDCASPPCETGWSVYSIDPATLVSKYVAGADETVPLQGASAAVPVGEEIWIGTYSGDRIGYSPRP